MKYAVFTFSFAKRRRVTVCGRTAEFSTRAKADAAAKALSTKRQRFYVEAHPSTRPR